MRTSKLVDVRFWLPDYLEEILNRIAEKKKTSKNKIITILLIKSIEEYAGQDLTENEKTAIRLAKEESEVSVLKYIRSRSAEKLNFMGNIHKQLWHFSILGKQADKKEVLNNMKLNLEIAKVHNWKSEMKQIKEIIAFIKKNGLPRDATIASELQIVKNNKLIEMKKPKRDNNDKE